LNGDAIAADAAFYANDPANLQAAGQWLYALNVGLYSIAQDLDARVRRAGPDQPVGLETPETGQPSITGTPGWDSERTQALAARACGACHSNQPNLPWYTNLAPVSWLVQYQVDGGRSALNFSEWDRPQVSSGAVAASSVQQQRKPPPWMVALDSRLRLTDAERAELVRGLHATLNGGAWLPE
jgi:mono/diheme cytochrome c family protein